MGLTTTQKGQTTKTSGPSYGWMNRLRAPKLLPGATQQSRSGKGCSVPFSSVLPLKGAKSAAAQKGGLELGSPLPYKMLGCGPNPSTVEQRKQDHKDSLASQSS